MTRKSSHALLAVVVLAAVTSVAGAVVFSRSVKQKPQQKFYRPAAVTEAPSVVSKVKDLEINGVRLLNPGTPGASVAIDVTNNRDSAVMCIDFVSGQKEYSALGIDGLLDEDKPRVVIPPHTLQMFTWSLGEIMEGQTIFLASAIFADGREEGDKRSLDGIKVHRRQFQKRERQGKAKNGGE
jgi:hypothetical protein